MKIVQGWGRPNILDFEKQDVLPSKAVAEE